jgi:hypothetical protein
MQDFPLFWLNYLEYCQRSWQDTARLWTPNFPTTAAEDENKSPGSLDMFSPDAWIAVFFPWVSKDANSNTFAGLAEATRVSLSAFTLWSEAFSRQAAAPRQPSRQEGKEQSSVERAVQEAIKRSNTQDA